MNPEFLTVNLSPEGLVESVEKHNKFVPFAIDNCFLKERLPFPYKVVWQNIPYGTCYAIRMDTMPFYWVIWWMYFRIIESWKIVIAFASILLETWSIIDHHPAAIRNFSTIVKGFKKKWLKSAK